MKVGTIFEDSPIPLDKWLPAVWMIVNAKNGISSYELGRALAWISTDRNSRKMKLPSSINWRQPDPKRLYLDGVIYYI